MSNVFEAFAIRQLDLMSLTARVNHHGQLSVRGDGLLGGLQSLRAVEVGHHPVEHHQIVVVASDFGDGALAFRHDGRGAALLAQNKTRAAWC